MEIVDTVVAVFADHHSAERAVKKLAQAEIPTRGTTRPRMI
jgi:hypothetical protein